MASECYHVVVPEGARLAGYTVAGQRVRIAPGEYVVHKMRPKVPLHGVGAALRFLGAHERGEDLHVPTGSEADVERVLQLVKPATDVATDSLGLTAVSCTNC
jgi:hypothetical protein